MVVVTTVVEEAQPVFHPRPRPNQTYHSVVPAVFKVCRRKHGHASNAHCLFRWHHPFAAYGTFPGHYQVHERCTDLLYPSFHCRLYDYVPQM